MSVYLSSISSAVISHCHSHLVPPTHIPIPPLNNIKSRATCSSFWSACLGRGTPTFSRPTTSSTQRKEAVMITQIDVKCGYNLEVKCPVVVCCLQKLLSRRITLHGCHTQGPPGLEGLARWKESCLRRDSLSPQNTYKIEIQS